MSDLEEFDEFIARVCLMRIQAERLRSKHPAMATAIERCICEMFWDRCRHFQEVRLMA